MNLGNRYSQHSFAQVPDARIQRSQFDRSFTVKDTIQFDQLTPIFVDEMLPGDTANVTLNMFARLSTQLVPIMDNMYIDYYFFFVPNRLTWVNWEKFNGAQDNPGDSTDFVIPTANSTDVNPTTGFPIGSIYDHMGVPVGKPNIKINALPLRAYSRIFNDWFRDQNMQPKIYSPTDNGPDTGYNIVRGNKQHDYFTSALPWPQKGPAVELNTSGMIPVITNGLDVRFRTTASATNRTMTLGDISTQAVLYTPGGTGTPSNVQWGSQTGLQADLSSGVLATVNELREAFMMQSLFELDARGGTRYVEILQAHFNVVSPDFRLQRPEYLGGGRSRITSHPVASTVSATGVPQANLAAFGTSSSSGEIGFTKSFVEHGYVIGLARPRADITYQQGLNKMWTRRTRYDFFWPKLQDLGEQAILSKEIYADGTANDELVFGYQERYAEYRYKPSEIHGKFRSVDPQSLDIWHMAEEFATRPSLNNNFMYSKTPIERALAVTTEPHLLFDGFFEYKHARPMAVRSIPATIGRF